MSVRRYVLWTALAVVLATRPAAAQINFDIGGFWDPLVSLLHHMKDNGIRYGLQTMCEGGGTANVTIIERLG